jgi:vesicle coat complex subunit
MAAIEDPLNLFPELAQLRAHYVDFIDRYDENYSALLAWCEWQQPGYKSTTDDGVDRPPAPRARHLLDLADGVRILSEISKVVKRIEDIRGRNAITRADFHRLMQEIGRCVEIAVDSQVPEQAEVIKSEISRRWREIRLT